ncbi:hypothetical protein C1645_834033 [Glomus cerebriforme]|uniref:Uncharacterized protein n=1 Tax=Glomus cerebriforme TaxID=658196 RepID=A0A397SCT4_9GLOM|nr:hypothetical protein C1645_834033 [Glomus cerebriforme]
MSDFLNRINYKNLCSLNDAPIFLDKAKKTNVLTISGKGLMKQNLEKEAKRLSYNKPDLHLIANEIWDSRLTESQKIIFNNLANRINDQLNAPTLNNISQINTFQVTNDPFAYNLLNGTNFYGDESLESLSSPFS